MFCSQDWAREFYIDASGTRVIVGVDAASKKSLEDVHRIIECSDQRRELRIEVLMSDADEFDFRYLMMTVRTSSPPRSGEHASGTPVLHPGVTIFVRHQRENTDSRGLFSAFIYDNDNEKSFGLTVSHVFDADDADWYVREAPDTGIVRAGRCAFREPETVKLNYKQTTADAAFLEISSICRSNHSNTVRIPVDLVTGITPISGAFEGAATDSKYYTFDRLQPAPVPPGASVLLQTTDNCWVEGRVDRSEWTVELSKKNKKLFNVMRIALKQIDLEHSPEGPVNHGDSGGLVVGKPTVGQPLDVYGTIIGVYVPDLHSAEGMPTFVVANRLQDVLTAIRNDPKRCETFGPLPSKLTMQQSVMEQATSDSETALQLQEVSADSGFTSTLPR